MVGKAEENAGRVTWHWICSPRRPLVFPLHPFVFLWFDLSLCCHFSLSLSVCAPSLGWQGLGPGSPWWRSVSSTPGLGWFPGGGDGEEGKGP